MNGPARIAVFIHPRAQDIRSVRNRDRCERFYLVGLEHRQYIANQNKNHQHDDEDRADATDRDDLFGDTIRHPHPARRISISMEADGFSFFLIHVSCHSCVHHASFA